MSGIRVFLVLWYFIVVFASTCANADTISIGGVLKLLGGGSLVFPDGSVQYTATIQGPKGDKGDTGATGLQGPPGQGSWSFDQANYYALGDSITYGTGSISGNYSYADAINAKLNFKSFTKLGESGVTTMQTPGRGELATQVGAIGANADIITVLIGANDYILNIPLGDVNSVLSKPYAELDKTLSFSEAFRYCLESIKRSHELSRIYVILPLQTSRLALIPDQSLEQFRDVEVKIANYLSIPVIHANIESGLWAGGTVFTDGIHPNDAGHTMLGNYLARKLSSL